MVSEFFEKPHDPASEEIVKNVAGVAYNGVYPILQNRVIDTQLVLHSWD